jgi:hypothetical protein
MKNIILFSLLFSLVLFSCEKVIDLDLMSSDTMYVLEGAVTSGDSAHYLSITTSIPFNQSNDFPIVDNATVTLTDNLGNTAAMIHIGEGIYEAQNYIAFDGRTYTMTAKIGERTFTSTVAIPFTVTLFGAVVLPSSFFGQVGNLIVPGFQDPAQYKNYYRFRYQEKDSIDNDSGDIISNDDISNGQVNQQPFIGAYLPASGDTVIYTMWGIDKSVYDFLYSKETNTSGNSGAPANPVSNWSGDALGYFTAHNVQQIEIIIP